MERRLQRLIALPVRIARLHLDVFSSSFVGLGVVIGPPRRPYVRLETVRIRFPGWRQLVGLGLPRGAARPHDLSLTLKAQQGELAGIAFSHLTLRARYDGRRLQVKDLSVSMLGGTVKLVGSLRLRRGRLGALTFKGRAAVRPLAPEEPSLEGKITLGGPSLKRLTLSGRLRASSRLSRRQGKEPGAPRVRLRLRVGRRRLQGTLQRWRLK